VVTVDGTLSNNTFIHLTGSINLHCLNRSTHMMENDYIHCLDLTSVWRRRWRRRPACTVERRRRWRRRLACTCGRAVIVMEETGSSSVDGGRGDQQSRECRGLRDFCDEKRDATRRATIYRFKQQRLLTRIAADCFGIQTRAILV
jgi:hypothetical protein